MHLYVHIPFCKKACHYCDFHFSINLDGKNQMVSAIAQEIHLQYKYLKNKALTTIYFGGGTPSLLNQNDFKVIFAAIKKTFDVSKLQECTIEVNPDDVNYENIAVWKSFGFNRISLGVQTFNETALKFMNRAHTSHQALDALELLKKHEMHNISIDLIYSNLAVGKDISLLNEVLLQDINKITEFDLPHISAYSLTIEDKTVFGKWKKTNKIQEIEEDNSAIQYELLVLTLANLGYEQYEVSNFAKNKQYAIHNTAYWQSHEYLGVGPSAHSYNLTSRQFNVYNNNKYIKSIDNQEIPYTLEVLSQKDQANDILLSGLRTIWGVDIKKISQITEHIPAVFWDKLEYYKDKNLITFDDNILKITKNGRILSDKIASDLFLD